MTAGAGLVAAVQLYKLDTSACSCRSDITCTCAKAGYGCLAKTGGVLGLQPVLYSNLLSVQA